MDRSPGFGSTTIYSTPYSDSLSLRLRLFDLTSHMISNSPVHSAKGTPSPINGLWLLVGTRFQVLFHSPSGVLFTFPSRYWFTIGHQEVFSLARWSWQIPTEFLVFRRTQDTARGKFNFAYGAITLCSNVSQRFLLSSFLSCCSPTTPKCKHFGLGCSLFARRYSGNRLISFSSCRY